MATSILNDGVGIAGVLPLSNIGRMSLSNPSQGNNHIDLGSRHIAPE